MTTKQKGEIYRVSGPVVTAIGIQPRMYDIVRVGKERLMGEVIEIEEDRSIIQVYEDTSGIRPGEPVINTGLPLTVELGPGLLTSIYDGIQRPLPILRDEMGDFIERGVDAPGLDHEKKWEFTPTVKPGDEVAGGSVIGTVPETPTIEHKILVPPKQKPTKVKSIEEGSFTIDETVCVLEDGTELMLHHRWPVREARPSQEKLLPDVPLNTGQRILDGLFPLAKGGTAAIPGPFGSGKCVAGDTPVLLADGRRVAIEELYESFAKGDAGESAEHLEVLETPLRVVGFDGQRLTPVDATQLYRGTTDRIVRIRTRTGRTVEVTPAHKLFRAQDGRIEETPAAELAVGEYLAVPRHVPIDTDGTYPAFPLDEELRCDDADLVAAMRDAFESIDGTLVEKASLLGYKVHDARNWVSGPNRPPMEFVRRVFDATGRPMPHPAAVKAERDSTPIWVPEVVDESLGEFLGLLMAEGTVKGGKVVEFYNNDPRMLVRFQELCHALFGIRPTLREDRTVAAASVNSRALVRLLSAAGMPVRKKSRTVAVPALVLGSPDEVVRAFIRAYAAGDGHFGERALEIATASRQMADGLLYLLARLGVIGRLATKKIAGRTYWRVFVSPKEASRIWPEKYDPEAPRFDSFDIAPLGKEQLQGLAASKGYANLKSAGIEIHNYLSAGEQLGRAKLDTLVELAPEQAQLASFARALEHVFCDAIVEIEVVEGVRPVFDLVVPETQNFVGGHQPFLLHNTVTQQALAKWSDAQVVVYIGCGERGNEMTEVLTEFPELEDPKSGNPLMDRTVLIANTSNMPVAAREASVYTGVTIAEYYRDQGYDVSLMADSTSRWAEAMREISSRLEEMPGEEGYPAYLAARLSQFYERAGRVVSNAGPEGSVSIIGAVSPPGGDFSEPVTQNTLRIVKVFWALDSKLAQKRHFPAINWLQSYSLYSQSLAPWYSENVADDWNERRGEAMDILQKESELQEIVQLVGSDALPEPEQLTIEVARMLREIFLQQNAFHDVDTYSPLKKQYDILTTILDYDDLARKTLDAGGSVQDITSIKAREDLARSKFEKDFDGLIGKIREDIKKQLEALTSTTQEVTA